MPATSPDRRRHAPHDDLLNEVVTRYLDIAEVEVAKFARALCLDTINDHLAFLWSGWTVAAAREVHRTVATEKSRHTAILLRHDATGTWAGLDLLLEMTSNGRIHTSWQQYHPDARLRAVAAQVVELRKIVITDSLTEMAERVGAEIADFGDGSVDPRCLRLLRLATLLLRLREPGASTPAVDLAEDAAAISTVAALGGFHSLAERLAADPRQIDAGPVVEGITVAVSREGARQRV